MTYADVYRRNYMSKAILVIDMPDSCDDCILARFINGKLACCATESSKTRWLDDNYMNKKSEWCPLKEMPKDDENEECYFPNEYQNGYARGWNECIRKITE